jgi:putative flippase GtrA
MRHQEVGRVGRFILVNGVGTVLDVGLVTALRHWTSIPIPIEVTAGWLVSMVSGFVLNRRFVFQDGQSTWFAASWRYFVLVGFNFLVGVGGVSLLVEHGWSYLPTRLLSSAFLVASNFVVARRWVFVVRDNQPPVIVPANPNAAASRDH